MAVTTEAMSVPISVDRFSRQYSVVNRDAVALERTRGGGDYKRSFSAHVNVLTVGCRHEDQVYGKRERLTSGAQKL